MVFWVKKETVVSILQLADDAPGIISMMGPQFMGGVKGEIHNATSWQCPEKTRSAMAVYALRISKMPAFVLYYACLE